MQGNADRIRALVKPGISVEPFRTTGVTVGCPALGVYCDISLKDGELSDISDKDVCARVLDPALRALNHHAHERHGS